MGTHINRMGARLGTRIAILVQQAMQAHLLESGHHRAMLHAEGLNEFHRQMGAELRPTLSPFLAQYLAELPADDPARVWLQFLIDAPGEAGVMQGILAGGQAAAQGIGSGIAALFATTNQLIMSGLQTAVLDPGTLAGLVAGGFLDHATAQGEAHRSNLNNTRFDQLVAAAQRHVSPPEAIEALRRGVIAEHDFEVLLGMGGVHGTDLGIYRALAHQLLAPADLALMVLKGILSEGDAATIAAGSGVSASDFSRLILATGEPPGIMELLEAYRRGFIPQSQLEHGIRQSRVRDEWIPTLEKLRYQPMSTSDAVRAVVQNHLQLADARKIADENGLTPGAMDILVQVEGNPLAPGQFYELWNRGIIGQAEVEQGLRESHLKNKYIPAALHLRERLPEGRQITTMLNHGALTSEQAHRLLLDHGYSAEVIAALIKSGTSGKTGAHKQLASTQITTLYEDQAIDEPTAAKMLGALGYAASEVEWILRLADLRVEHAYLNAAVAHVRQAMVSRHITAQVATGRLDALGLRAQHRDQLIHLWSLEVESTVKVLTPAQILKAHKTQAISDQDALDRLTREGYSTADAELLITIDGGGLQHG